MRSNAIKVRKTIGSRGFGRAYRGRLRRRRLRHRQAYPDSRALVDRTFRLDGAAIRLHNGLGDGQAQPEAAGFARTRTVAPAEAFKNVGKIFGGDAAAPILHADAGAVRLAQQLQAHPGGWRTV